MTRLRKKTMALLLAALMLTGALAGCQGSPSTESSTPPTEQSSGAPSEPEAPKGKVYFQNFKPEQADAYVEIAKQYTEKTGVEVKVETAAAGTYEQKLKSEMSKTDAPTIFQINGPVGFASWKEYCADLKDSEIYSHLMDKSIAITEGDGVYGIPFAIEGYGIIYNDEIMQKYFAADGAKASSVDEINSFDKLKAVVEDMTAKKDALGIKGVFANTSLKKGEDWRWQTHLANVPLYYEFQKNSIDLSAGVKEIEFSYSDNYKNIFDLYLDNSTTDKKMLGSKSVNDSMTEFALGQCAMVQNGNWAYGDIAKVSGNKVKPENVKFMPIYIGVDGEEKQGLCIGTENFFCINKNVPEEDQKASLDFLTWLYTDAEGKKAVNEKLGFIAPFDSFTDDEKPTDPLAQEVLAYSAKDGVNNVPWNFTIFPSQKFKDDFGADLLGYAQGSKTWDDVKTGVVNGWKTEAAATAQ